MTVETDPQHALFLAADLAPDLVVVSADLETFDGLRVCSQLRSLDRTRHLSVLLVAEGDDKGRVLRALDIGVNDFLVRRSTATSCLPGCAPRSGASAIPTACARRCTPRWKLAVVDPLTGLHNRRYLDTHFATLVEEAQNRGRPLAALVLDVDRFKAINDTWGHDAGDDVLREFAQRVRRSVRGIDLVARFGGEEVVVLMPDTPWARRRSSPSVSASGCRARPSPSRRAAPASP